MRFKIIQEKDKMSIPMDQVTYAGLFLTRRALEWFKPYLTKIQTNKITTLNQEIKYMFSSWEGFLSQLTQIYNNIETVITAERKLSKLMQKGSATKYTITFQTYTTQTK